MFLREVVAALLRRWYLFPVVLVVAGASAAAALSQVGPVHRATASVVLVPPETTLAETGNPYLFLGGLEQSVDVLSRTVDSQRVREEVEEAEPGGSYEVVADTSTSAPIVLITAEAGSAADADRLLDRVLEIVPRELAALQDDLGVAQRARITTQTVARTDRPETVQRTRYRLTVLAAGLGGVLGLMLVVTVDGLLLRRRRRRSVEGTTAVAALAPDSTRDR
jgi:uncharacterized protein involved in exopolysaccharide biosynthesis